MKVIICFYTCRQDLECLDRIKRTSWHKKLRAKEGYSLLDVYASHKLRSKYVINNGTLTVREQERYTGLSLKTYSMMAACLDLEFDYLVKIDATVVDPKKVKRPEESFGYMKKAILNPSFYRQYNGTCKHTCKKPWGGVVNWASKKGIREGVRPNLVFKDMSKVEYFCGKTYVVGRDFCSFLVKGGRHRASMFAKHLGGSEDLMVGSMYYDFLREGVKNA